MRWVGLFSMRQSGHSSRRSAAIIARSGHCSHGGERRLRRDRPAQEGQSHVESRLRLRFEPRDIGEGQLEDRGRHRGADLRLQRGRSCRRRSRACRHPLPERRGEAQAQPDPRLHLPRISSAWSRNTSCLRCSTTSGRATRTATTTRCARSCTSPRRRRSTSSSSSGSCGSSSGVRHALRRHRPGRRRSRPAILDHSPARRLPATLQIEWMTQKHYLESVKDNAAEGLDPLFCSLLKHHWIEESQHAKLDTLVVDEIASNARRRRRSRRGSTTTWTSARCSTAA